MNTVSQYIGRIAPVDESVLEEVQSRLDNQTKPPGSLGRLEEIVKRLAAIQRTADPVCTRKMIFTLAGDHGVVEEGVSAFPQSVTTQMVQNFIHGGAAVNVLARHAGCDMVVVDMGVASAHPFEGCLDRKIAPGTSNFTRGPAMTRAQAEEALTAGVALALDNDFDIVGTGEMGIGNTTPAAAVASVLSGTEPELMVGRGTGVDDWGLQRKVDAVRRGIDLNEPDPKDPVGVLAAVGGFEIGGIAGLIIGAAVRGKPVVVDGYISTAGALVAAALSGKVRDYIMLSHRSAERGHDRFVNLLGGEPPLLDLGMRLGEGTGAALAMEIIDAALDLYRSMATFESAGVDQRSDET
jgi:nicotinate-nucleotide--dimethylbenzimidazole phosphoribosyltransferase